jgi:coenzyme F420-dependent glucose-6-phosphate dehydrogenase
MPQLGYHASHEQFRPRDLLEYTELAKQAGFDAVMCSDHFHPWSEQQGSAGSTGFAWSWLGAAMQAVSVLPFGVVTVPGYRYHPAILAQATATLADMYPGQFWVALGSGEALNEHITGQVWPTKAERNARLKECVDVIRALWAGETVTHYGRVVVDEAKLYVRPSPPPPIIGAALSPETAEWLGGWADGMITITMPKQGHRQIIDAFRSGGGRRKPIYVQAQISYASSDEEALHNAHQEWRTAIFKSPVLAALRMPYQFDAAAEYIRPNDVEGHIRTSADLKKHLDWIQEDFDLGVTGVFLHNVGRNQHQFIDTFGEYVLNKISHG